MKTDIDKIRELLNLIENEGDIAADESFKRSFELFELPEIISSVVDYLQPLLYPYEAVIYWYMFRHSIVETGDVYVRVGTRGMMEGVVVSASGQSAALSYGTVQKALAGLIEKKLCCKLETQIERLPEIELNKEQDFYNIKENRQQVFERDTYKCHYCDKQLTRFSAALNRIHPVSEGGVNSYDNLVTSCLRCNSSKGARPVMDVITEGN